MLRSKILFLIPYPTDRVASQRFRFEQYLSTLATEHTCDIRTFFSLQTFSILYKNGHKTEKVWGFVVGYLKFLLLLTKVKNYDKVFIHREATPLGPPIIEWIIARVFHKPIIYDFDDAIWLPDDQTKEHNLWAKLKFRQKISSICRWSYMISCGNEYLAQFARKHNSRVYIVPTTIDTVNHHLPRHTDRQIPVIGWTGTQSTLPYLQELIPVLKELSIHYKFIFKVICNRHPDFSIPDMQYIPWSKSSEIEDLNSIDIGVMPIPETNWTLGKCGFKILQYLALEKAAVASAVGVNVNIIKHGQNGLLCQRQPDWFYNLVQLISDKSFRNKLGRNGRATVEQYYSKSAIEESFVRLFN